MGLNSVLGRCSSALGGIIMGCVTIIAAVLFIVLIASSDEPKSVPLIVILGITSFLMILSMIVKYGFGKPTKKSENGDHLNRACKIINKLFRPSNVNMMLFHSSAITMLLILVTRLAATEQFGGSVTNLNYGPKISSGKNTGDNYTMDEFNFASFGHFIQGVLCCLFSYPAIAGMIAKLCGGRSNGDGLIFKVPNIIVLVVMQLLSACLTLYPTYSLIKRKYKDGESFSRSSHLNNVSEWVLGYVLANGISWLVNALLEMKIWRKAGMNIPDEEMCSEVIDQFKVEGGGDDEYGFGKASEYVNHGKEHYKLTFKIMTGLSTALLILHSITTLLTGIFIGMTWNYDEKDDQVNSRVITQFVLYQCFVVLLMRFLSMEPK